MDKHHIIIEAEIAWQIHHYWHKLHIFTRTEILTSTNLMKNCKQYLLAYKLNNLWTSSQILSYTKLSDPNTQNLRISNKVSMFSLVLLKVIWGFARGVRGAFSEWGGLHLWLEFWRLLWLWFVPWLPRDAPVVGNCFDRSLLLC